MVRAMGHLPEALGVRLMLAGSFTPGELEEELNRLPAWMQVEYLGWLSRPSIAELLHNSRIGIVVLQPIPNYVESQPIKLYEYMSAGLPVIASDFPLWRRIVDEAECGLLVDPLDPKAIAGAIQWLLEHSEQAEAMGRRGQEAVREKYNWDAESKKLLAFYEDLLR